MKRESKEPSHKEEEKPSRGGKMIAKRDFILNCPKKSGGGFYREIKKGDDVSDVPKKFHPNLKTENVI